MTLEDCITEEQKKRFKKHIANKSIASRRKGWSSMTAEDAKALVRFAQTTVWKKPVPELIGKKEIVLIGASAFKSLSVKSIRELLAKCFDGFGTLNQDKALEYIHSTPNHAQSRELNKRFFENDNPHRESNAQNYLLAYQQINEKRKSDLDAKDFAQIPKQVREILGIFTVEDLRKRVRKESPATEGSYHVVQIDWSPDLEARLRDLVKNRQLSDAQSIWDTLGTTIFGAHMKAQELGLIPRTVQFGDGEKQGFPTYALVEFDGYPFAPYALQVNVEQAAKVDVHCYTSPVHGQIMHVNTPIIYKGIELSEYTEREQEILKTLAAYIHDPNQFGKVKGTKGIYEHKAPEQVNEKPRIVPVKVNDQLFAQVYLPTKFSEDPGGVYTSVLTNKIEIYFFKHDQKGKIAA